jgi:cyclopropane fatty-acyl-phospholipid synthase-like methyltransferase
MTILSQSNFPLLWDWFQFWIGGTIDKRKLCSVDIQGDERILEVGCSTGNIAEVFSRLPNIQYVGLDIDLSALKRATEKFESAPNLKFTEVPFLDFQEREKPFDIVLFAGILHHIDDATVEAFLNHSRSLIKPDGRVIVVDPVLPEAQDPKLFHYFSKLERGQFVRSEDHLRKLLLQTAGLRITKSEAHFIGATPWSLPKVLRFGRYQLQYA